MQRLALAFMLITAVVARAQSPTPDEAAIRALMTTQADAWNRADIPAFMQVYEDSPETTFIGAKIGRASCRERV